MDREAYLQVYRHSLAHVLAKAVIEIFGRENVQYAIGPQIADGFYYDFVLPRNLTQDDFPMIENKMREILKRKENWSVKEYSRDEARELFRDQKFKTRFRRMRDSLSIRRETIIRTSAADRMWKTLRTCSARRSRLSRFPVLTGAATKRETVCNAFMYMHFRAKKS